MAESKYRSIGFIGLGAMGKPMAVHLANKLPSETRIHVFDVVQTVVEQVCADFPDRVYKGSSAKDVAEKSVGSMSRTIPLALNAKFTKGTRIHDGPGRLTRKISIPR